MEVLACPHCERLFQVAPGVLGKNIRCRGCRGIFSIPIDTTTVPLSPEDSAGHRSGSALPLAIACISSGQDARSCPQCQRMFRMNESLAGKTIRCRNCKLIFRVEPTDGTLSEPRVPLRTSLPQSPTFSADRLQQPPPPASATPEPTRPPTVFEDIGDVLEQTTANEEIASVVRPRRIPGPIPSGSSPVARMIAVLLGGICALPASLFIIWLIAPEQYRGIVSSLPVFLREMLD